MNILLEKSYVAQLQVWCLDLATAALRFPAKTAAIQIRRHRIYILTILTRRMKLICYRIEIETQSPLYTDNSKCVFANLDDFA